MKRPLGEVRRFCRILLLVFTVVFPKSTFSIELRTGLNLEGSRFGTDSDASPADANGAVGLQHFVELVNGRFSVYLKETGERVQTSSDIEFWNSAGVRFASTVGVTDPRIIFDSDSKRWFASMVDFTVNSRRQRSNHFLLAVSSTDDPTQTWTGFSFAADTNGVNFADFPTLGIDRYGLYLGGDMFDRFGNSVGATLFFLPKADLIATSPDISKRHSFGTLSYAARGDILQPSITSGNPTSDETVLAVSDLGLNHQTFNTLVMWSVLKSPPVPALSSPAIFLQVPEYSVPINPPQPDGTDNLDDGDARFAASTRRVGDFLYAVHAVQFNNRAAVRWYKIDVLKSSLIEAGTISSTNLDLFYPSIAANENGIVVIGCNGASADAFVGSYATAGEVVGGKLTFGHLVLLKRGTASYQNPDASGISRWGDYSATSPDPLDPSRFWTIQMIPVSPAAWATQITELIVGQSLNISRTTNGLSLQWPPSLKTLQLQQSTTLKTGSWKPVALTVETSGSGQSVQLLIDQSAGFFRLAPITTDQ